MQPLLLLLLLRLDVPVLQISRPVTTATTYSSANRELRPEVRTLLCEVVASVFCECLRASQTLRAAEAVVDISSVCEVRVFIKSGIVLLQSVCDKQIRQATTIRATISTA